MFLSLKYQGRIIVFKVLFRQCKNITIKINVDGELIVTAPAGTNNEVILVALQNKVKWIINQIDYFNRLKPETRQCIEGELFLYLGKEYTLQIKHINAILKESQKR
ncbi:MAG: YgjP-like metallopeptidase domain-containing protein [Syntrophomonadaceae bacterium]|jgi:predicted metal-dependent hydrolase